MVKVILQLYPMLHAPTTRPNASSSAPSVGTRSASSEYLEGLPDIAKAADELGLWGIASIEHHFHSEGYEVGPNPGILDAYWAAITENVRVGQLGYVDERAEPDPRGRGDRPARPARPAAVASSASPAATSVGGRTCSASTSADGPRCRRRVRAENRPRHVERAAGQGEFADDEINREVFEEQVDMVLKAWTNDSIEAKGRWQIPFPYEEGIDWTMTATRRDRRGRARWTTRTRSAGSASCPPRSGRSIRRSSSPATPAAGDDRVLRAARVHPHLLLQDRTGRGVRPGLRRRRPAAAAYALGQNQALVRWLQIGETAERPSGP